MLPFGPSAPKPCESSQGSGVFNRYVTVGSRGLRPRWSVPRFTRRHWRTQPRQQVARLWAILIRGALIAREAQFVVSIWKLGTPTMLMTREASPPSKGSFPDCASDSFAIRTS
jgi:hypothetical protein